MNKFHRFSENMYLFFGFIFMIEVIVNVQNVNQRFYISCILGAAAFGMFFFRRKYRKKFESRNQNQKWPLSCLSFLVAWCYLLFFQGWKLLLSPQIECAWHCKSNNLGWFHLPWQTSPKTLQNSLQLLWLETISR